MHNDLFYAIMYKSTFLYTYVLCVKYTYYTQHIIYRKWKWKFGGWIAATRTHISMYLQSKRTSSHHVSVYQFRYTTCKYTHIPHI